MRFVELDYMRPQRELYSRYWGSVAGGVVKAFVGVFGFVVMASVAANAQAQQTQTYTYDVHGRLTAVTRTTGASTQTTTYGLDNADNRTSRLLGAPTASAAMAAPEDVRSTSLDAAAEPSETDASVGVSETSPDGSAASEPNGPSA